MPIYDYACRVCERIAVDILEPMTVGPRVCGWSRDGDDLKRCPGIMDRVLLPTHRNNVIGDECDILVKHGLCHADGTPQRFTSKTEMRREAHRRGLTPHVTHQADSRGSDKSKHTSRWI